MNMKLPVALFCSLSLLLPLSTSLSVTENVHRRPGNAIDSLLSNGVFDIWEFLDAPSGGELPGLANVKRYLQKLGYFPAGDFEFSDHYDPKLEGSLRLYQFKLGLPVTGALDRPTLTQLVAPRCGVHENHTHNQFESGSASKLSQRFQYFPGRPRWPPGRNQLMYWISPSEITDYLSLDEVHGALARAFDKWSVVIPINFTQTQYPEDADIRVGFYDGDHGDGEPFDGVLGVLAHAFSPENGRLHLDRAETWSVDFGSQRSKVAVDLESVALHEIGHLLGLGHSSVRDAVMYPSLLPRSKKTDLTLDDVEGVQSLYGSNPNLEPDSVESGEQVDSGANLRVRPVHVYSFLVIVYTFHLLFM